GPGARVEAGGRRAPERRAHAVDEDDLAQLAGHGTSRRPGHGRARVLVGNNGFAVGPASGDPLERLGQRGGGEGAPAPAGGGGAWWGGSAAGIVSRLSSSGGVHATRRTVSGARRFSVGMPCSSATAATAARPAARRSAAGLLRSFHARAGGGASLGTDEA